MRQRAERKESLAFMWKRKVLVADKPIEGVRSGENYMGGRVVEHRYRSSIPTRWCEAATVAQHKRNIVFSSRRFFGE